MILSLNTPHWFQKRPEYIKAIALNDFIFNIKQVAFDALFIDTPKSLNDLWWHCFNLHFERKQLSYESGARENIAYIKELYKKRTSAVTHGGEVDRSKQYLQLDRTEEIILWNAWASFQLGRLKDPVVYTGKMKRSQIFSEEPTDKEFAENSRTGFAEAIFSRWSGKNRDRVARFILMFWQTLTSGRAQTSNWSHAMEGLVPPNFSRIAEVLITPCFIVL